MDARVRSVLLVLLWGVGVVSGDWMLHTPGGGPIEDRCPCLPVALCPRPFGLSPHDVRQFGHLPVCMDVSYVRCCGASFSVKVSPSKHSQKTLHNGLDGVELYDSSAGDLIDERQNPQALKRASQTVHKEVSNGQVRNVTEQEKTNIVAGEANSSVAEEVTTVRDQHEWDTFINSTSLEYQDDSEVVDVTTSTEELVTLWSDDDEVTEDSTVTPERLSLSITISFSTSESNRNDSSSTPYRKTNATCEEIQTLMEHLQGLDQEEWEDKGLGHDVDNDSSAVSSGREKDDGDVFLVYPVKGHRGRSNDVDVAIVYPMNSVCAQVPASPEEVKTNSSTAASDSQNSTSTENTTDLPEITQNATGSQNNTSQIPEVQKLNELDDPESEFGFNATDSNLDYPVQKDNLTGTAEELDANTTTDGLGRNSTQLDELSTILQSRRMLFGQRIRQKVLTQQQRNRTRLVDLFSKYSRQSPLGRSSRLQSGNVRGNGSSTTENSPQNTSIDLVVGPLKIQSSETAESPTREQLMNFTTTAIEYSNISHPSNSYQETLAEPATLSTLDVHIEEEIEGSGSDDDHKQRSRSVTVLRERRRKYNQSFRKSAEVNPDENGRLSTMNGLVENESNTSSGEEAVVSNQRIVRPRFSIFQNVREPSRNHHRERLTGGRKVLVSKRRLVPTNTINVVGEDKSSGSTETPLDTSSAAPRALRGRIRVLKRLRGTVEESQNTADVIPQTPSNPEGPSEGDERDEARANLKRNRTLTNRVEESQNIPQPSSKLEGPSEGDERDEARDHLKRIRTLKNRLEEPHNTAHIIPQTSSKLEGPFEEKKKDEARSHAQRIRTLKNRLEEPKNIPQPSSKLEGPSEGDERDEARDHLKRNRTLKTRLEEPHNTAHIIPQTSSKLEGPFEEKKKDEARSHAQRIRTLKNRVEEPQNTAHMIPQPSSKLEGPSEADKRDEARAQLKRNRTLTNRLEESQNSAKIINQISGKLEGPSEGGKRVEARAHLKRIRTLINRLEEPHNTAKIIPQPSSKPEGHSEEIKKDEARVAQRNKTSSNRVVERYTFSKTRLFSPFRPKPKESTIAGPEHHSSTFDAIISEEPLTVVHRGGRETFQQTSESPRVEEWEKRKKIAEMELRNPLVFQLPEQLESERQNTIPAPNTTVVHQNLVKNQEKMAGSAGSEDLVKAYQQQNQLIQPGPKSSVHFLHDDKGKLKDLEEAVQDVWKLHQSLSASSSVAQQPENWAQLWLDGFPQAQQPRPLEPFRASPPDPGLPPDQGPQQDQIVAMMQQMLPPPLPFYTASPVPREHPDTYQQYYQQLHKYHLDQVHYYQRLRHFLSRYNQDKATR